MKGYVFKALLRRLQWTARRQLLFVMICILVPITLVAIATASFPMRPDKLDPHEYFNSSLNSWIDLSPESCDILFNGTNLQGQRDIKWSIFYYPVTEGTNAIMGDFQKRVDPNVMNVTASNYSSPLELEKYFTTEFGKDLDLHLDADLNRPKRYGFAVIFNEVSQNKLSYTLRSTVMDIYQPLFIHLTYRHYIQSGFITIQSGVNMGYMNYLNMTFGNWSFQTFPPFYEMDKNLRFSCWWRTPLILFGMLPLILIFVSKIVTEKTSGSRELLRLNGVSDVGIYGFWFVFIMLECLVIMTAFAIIFKASKIVYISLPNSNPILVWTFLMLFSIHLCFMIFAISSLFNNAVYATVFATIATCASGFIYFFDKPTNSTIGILFEMTPMGALHHGLAIATFLDTFDDGLQFHNLLFVDPYTGAGPMSTIIVALIIGTFLFALVFIYMIQVKPGRYGIAKPWYFPIQECIRIICCKSRGREQDSEGDSEDKQVVNGVVEYVNLPVGLKIRNLYKEFGTFIAINNFSIDIYKDQITVLLGHNGAGKTTLMSILTGILSPTKGKVIVNDSNLFENMNEFRKEFGYCPQHDICLQNLTVQEQIIFFGMVRGLPKAEASVIATDLMKEFKIFHRRNALPSLLSGGMKRKLCLAISLANDPKVLLLDEPSSGLDPQSRREIWNILLEMRGNRTAIITTHFMEEADVLGDKIAIMAHGELRCYGSSMFLKQHYGTGHRITVTYSKQANYVESIKSIVMDVIPAVKIIENQQQNQIAFTIPLEHNSKLSYVFSKLESAESSLDIKEIGVTCTSMEDIFLKVQEGEGISTDFDDKTLEKDNYKKIKGVALVFQRLCALLKKRVICLKSTIIFGIISLILIPILFFYLTFELTKWVSVYFDNIQPINLSLALYGKTSVLVGGRNAPVVDAFIERVKMEQSVPIVSSNHVHDELLIVARKEEENFRYKMIVAADFTENPIVYFSIIATHGPAIVTNLLFNAFINNAQYSSSPKSIEVINHPYKGEDPCKDFNLSSWAPMFQQAWIFPCVAVLFSLTYFVIFPIIEKRNGIKKLQYMSGLSPFTYWASNVLFDFSLFCIVLLICSVSAYAFDTHNILYDHDVIGLLFLTAILYAFAMIALGYFLSHVFKTPAAAINVLALISVSCVIIVYVLPNLLLDYFKEETKVEAVVYVLYFSPSAPFFVVILDTIKLASDRLACRKCSQRGYESENCNGVEDDLYYKFQIGLIFLAVDILLFFVLTILLDYRLLQLGFHKFSSMPERIKPRSDSVDSDVWTEKRRVAIAQGKKSSQREQKSESLIDRESMDFKESRSKTRSSSVFDSQDVVLITDNLGKKYKGKLTAVYDVSFVAEKGECFGLLGVNGAGKTTTFSMLSGDIFPSHGDATLIVPSGTYTLSKSRNSFLQNIGYCPQENCLHEDMTGCQLLKHFALMRGATRADSSKLTKQWTKNLDLHLYCDKPCGNYSGGNKRKLCTGIALIANPPLILLDEPTTGVDPVTKSKIWKIFNKIRSNDQTIVLTSHSLDECEATCNRLTIMVAGRMRCIGTVQHLKHKFAQGFKIYIKIDLTATDEQVQSIKNTIFSNFGELCQLKDEYKGFLHFHLGDNDYKRSALFKKMTEIKRYWEKIEEFMVSDTSLEEVFLTLANEGQKAPTPE